MVGGMAATGRAVDRVWEVCIPLVGGGGLAMACTEYTQLVHVGPALTSQSRFTATRDRTVI